MSEPGSNGDPTPAPDDVPPSGTTRIQHVQGKGRWRIWTLAALVVLALVAVGLILWAEDRQTADDEAVNEAPAGKQVPPDETTTTAETTIADTTVVTTTTAPTTTTTTSTTVAPTTAAPTTAAPTTAAPTTAASTTLTPTTTAPAFQGVLAAVARQPELSTFTDLLAAAGIFSVPEPVTVFGPTNAGFDALPDASMAYLEDPDNVAVLRQVLLNHFVAGSYPVADLPTDTTLTSLDGQELEITSERDRLLVNDVPIVDADIDGGDESVIHAIDGVLVPPNVNLPS